MATSKPGLEKVRTDLRRRFAANVRAHRTRLGLSQEKTAERVGFSLQYLQRIEREIVNVPLDTIARFGLALGIDPAQLLDGDVDDVSPGSRRRRSRARGST